MGGTAHGRVAVLVCAVLLAAAVLWWYTPADITAAGPRLQRGIDVPTRPTHVAPSPLGTPAPAPAGEGGYAFARTHPDGTPVTFDPCRRLHYVVRPDGEPPEGAEMLRSVLAELATATGLRFVYDGSTDEAPAEDRSPYQRARYGDRWAPVLIAWSQPEESPELTGRVLGRAGPDAFSTGAEGSERFVSGMAVFNGPRLDDLLSSGQEAKARAVFLHELGHLVGLAHVADPYQVMHDTNLYPIEHYAAGDLRGLELLGMGRCFRDY